MLPTIEWQGDTVVMVDQRKLPAQEIYVRCRTSQEVAKAIRTMVIRGAPAIGVAAAMGIALGSCIQIALFVAPMLVLLSYAVAPAPLELSFGRAEIGSLFLAVLIGAIVSGDGRANWYKGVQLITVYTIIAFLFYFLPEASTR